MPALMKCSRSRQFACRDGRKCVSKSFRCDDYRDCYDGSDEAQCCKPVYSRESNYNGDCNLMLHEISCHVNGKRKCLPSSSKCDGVLDCDDFSDESACCDNLSSTKLPPSVIRGRSTTTIRQRTTTRKYLFPTAPRWYDDNYNFHIPTVNSPDDYKLNYDNNYGEVNSGGSYSSGHETSGSSAGGISIGTIFGIFILAVIIAVIRRACCRLRGRRFVALRQERSSSTQSLTGRDNDIGYFNDIIVNSTPGTRLTGHATRQSTPARPQNRTVLIRTRSSNDLRANSQQQSTSPSSGPSSGPSSQPQQQQQQRQNGDGNGGREGRTTEALHLMVCDGPWLTTRTLRPMIPEQPNFPLFIHESSVHRLDDRSGLVVQTAPQLMMYVDGEFVWVPASRVPEALHLISLQLNLQAEEGPPPAAAQQIENLPSLTIPQETIELGGRCSVCLEEFHADETVRELPCRHYFHSDCIIPWLQLNGTCPSCRAPISAGNDETAETAPTADVTENQQQ